MEANTNDEEAPKDPGASKALTSLQDNDIFGKLNRFTKQKKVDGNVTTYFERDCMN